MKHILPDGRELMARYADIRKFFDQHAIVGREIADIRPSKLDYMIRNLGDIENICDQQAECGIETAGTICIIFADGDNIEIEFCGDGPLLIGFNTADYDRYPKYDGSCYTLHTLFGHALGRKIVSDVIIRSEHHMLFSEHCGNDMCEDNEGVEEIFLCLDDGTILGAEGHFDWLTFCHFSSDSDVYVPYRDLLAELNEQTLRKIFGAADRQE